MSFLKYLKRNYEAACLEQHRITRDPQMVSMLRGGTLSTEFVRSWMESYGLFQGNTQQQRNDIAKTFLRHAKTFGTASPGTLKPEKIAELYENLFTALYRKVGRSWMSATSKLLWCAYPHDIVIYDAFVHRALVVLQSVDDDLASFHSVGLAPTIQGEPDIADATAYYMNYQNMARHLQAKHQSVLDNLRLRHHESYPYDVRIVDKLLWMIGNPNRT